MTPTVLHLTTTAVSLDWLLGPQLEAFDAAGYRVLTASAPGAHVAPLRDRGIAHHAIPSLSRNMDLRRDLSAWREIGDLIDEVRPDIVHTHNPKPGVIGRLAAKRHRVPIVVNTVHGLYAQPTDPLLRRAPVFGIERLAATCSDAELVQNPEDVDLLLSLGVPRDRVHLLGNGIDLSRFSPSPARSRSARALRRVLGIATSTPVVGMVGRLVWEKGYRELFEAVRELRSRTTTPFQVVVVGPGEHSKDGSVEEEEIEQMRERGVHFVGQQDNVELWLSMFDVFVLPSHREGFPRAAMEASAVGTPVIATDIRGCRQVVDHERTGLLVPVRDSVALANAIERLVRDSSLRRSFGDAAHARAQAHFDHDRVIARTTAIYRALLRQRGVTSGSKPASQSVSDRYNASIDLVAADASKPTALERAW